jgi:sigma-B regulation protein RsbU (phosphoserine phosphatase)
MLAKGSLLLKNALIGANFIANFVAVFFVNSLFYLAGGEEDVPPAIAAAIAPFDISFTAIAFCSIGLATWIYELPIRHCITQLLDGQTIPANTLASAQKRLLNEPFILIGMDLLVWLLAACLYPFMLWYHQAGPEFIHLALFMSLSTGLVTITVAFFLLQHLLQKRYAPVFFPHGGMNTVKGTLRVRISTRLGALLFAANLIPLLSFLHTVYRFGLMTAPPELLLTQLRGVILINALIYIIIGLVLTFLVTRNLTIPLREIIDTLQQIKRGRFDSKVRVISNDEIGDTGDTINAMIDGLKERDHLRESLRLAMEVQQNLMPKNDPQAEGLEIAGTSIYCEQTGGDYYDYLIRDSHIKGRVGIIVGDVSDHGIPSALLMTTGRAFLRQRAAMAGELFQIVGDVNQEMCQDVEESGRFMTLLFCEIDRPRGDIRWVNAGHEPGMIYDGHRDQFFELGGRGLPLGVFEDTKYQEMRRPIAPGQIVIIGTDGIWECRNRKGQMFGKDRFKSIIRSYAQASARQMIDAVIGSLEAYCGPTGREDDITIVVVKILKI